MKILANLSALPKKTDANLPFGKTIQDEDETQVGTPIVADLMQDIFSNLYRLLEVTKITPTNAFDGDTEGYQIIDALQKLPNTMNDIEQVLTLDGTTWSVPLDLSILPNKYFFLARPSDDYDIAETYDFKGSGDDTYSFTSEYFKTGNLLSIVIDTGTVRSYTISKSLQNVLDTNPIATFSSQENPNKVAFFIELVNEVSEFFSEKKFAILGTQTQTNEHIELGFIKKEVVHSEEGIYTSNIDAIYTLEETSGNMNILKELYKSSASNNHNGYIRMNYPTPKIGASGINVNINFPYREKTGDYSLATIDLVDDYANDAAALASGRIPVGGLYHTAGVVKVRLT